jgi:RNA polymerase sigma factor for flagellar operon FliA
MAANDIAADTAGTNDGQATSDELADSAEVNRRFQSELDLVEIVAGQVSRAIDNCVDFDELLAAGREGLFEAARRFEPTRGASFRTYANYRVEGAIIDAVRHSLQLPRRVYERLTALEAAGRISRGEYSLGVRDTAQWHHQKDPEDFINDELAAMATAAALSVELSRAESSSHPSDSPEEAYERAELLALVEAAIDELGEAEAEAIRLYYFEEKSHAATAAAMKLSKPWVHRIHQRAMSTITKRLRNAGYV